MPTPSFRLRPTDVDPATVLYVDGVEPGFRSLSHWPGNTTPAGLARETSTAIVLEWASRPANERERLVGAFEVVANNHYDTDGALSVWAALHPDEALAHREAALDAAAAGDFAVWRGPDALAVDLTVMALPRHPASPLAARFGPDTGDEERWETCYRWLADELGAILVDPFRHEALWSERHARISAAVAAVDAGRGPAVTRHPGEDLAVVEVEADAEADAPLTAVALHRAVGDLYRVLVTRTDARGTRYRLLLRDESWFDLGRDDAPRRPRLEPLRARLAETETARGGSWWATAQELPVAQLGFGDADAGPGAFFADLDLAVEPPSALTLPEVVATVREVFAADDAAAREAARGR